MARIEVELGDHSLVEQLTEPGKKVYAHVRLHVFKDEKRKQSGFEVMRISPLAECSLIRTCVDQAI